MIEVITKNGYRRMIKCSLIASVGELRGESSKSVITLSNGEVIFVVDSYQELKEAYYLATERRND